jgi:L,D-transpeptidase catalytic domain
MGAGDQPTLLRAVHGRTAAAIAVASSLVAPAQASADAAGIQDALASVATRLTVAGVDASPDGPAGTRVSRAPRPHRLAVLRGSTALSERPGGPASLQIGPTTEFGSPRVLGVAGRRGDWLGVVATERPNNRLAWLRRDSEGLTLRRTRWSLHADLSARTLTLRRAGRRVHRMATAIGRPGSETPTGRFAVTDKLDGGSYGAYYGCCILALSGHQPNTPPGWTGGDRLAIHGTDSPSTIGAAASAGCLRAAEPDLRRLMREVPLGTPVFIRR